MHDDTHDDTGAETPATPEVTIRFNESGLPYEMWAIVHDERHHEGAAEGLAAMAYRIIEGKRPAKTWTRRRRDEFGHLLLEASAGEGGDEADVFYDWRTTIDGPLVTLTLDAFKPEDKHKGSAADFLDRDEGDD